MRWAIFGCVLLGLPGIVDAQPLWLAEGQRNGVFVEWLKPVLTADEPSVTPLTSVVFPTLRTRLGSDLQLVVDLPVAHYNSDGSDAAQTVVGNPYLGVENRDTGKSRFGELGIRIPWPGEGEMDARRVGQWADVDRWEAWPENLLSILGWVNYLNQPQEGFGYRLRGGVIFSIFLADRSDVDLLIPYAGQVLYRGGRASLAAGLSGRLYITQALDMVNQLAISGAYLFGHFRPGVALRIPLDTVVRNHSDFSLGFTVELLASQP